MRIENGVTPVHRQSSIVNRQSRDTKAILLLLLAIYLLTASGHLYSPDEEAMYYVTRGVARGSDVALPQGDVVPLLGRRGLDRQAYAPYGVLPSLLALPFYGAGALAAGVSSAPASDYLTRFAVSLLNALLTACTGALLYVFTRRLGFRRRAGWLAALAFGLCTFAWPYARTFFSEPLAGLLLLAAVERASTFRSTGNRAALWLSGLAAGLLLATRLAEVIALPLLLLYVLWPKEQRTNRTIEDGRWTMERESKNHRTTEPQNQEPRTKNQEQGYRTNTIQNSKLKTQNFFCYLVILSQWVLALIPGLALVVGYNLLRFGTPLATGYGDESSAFTTPLLTGLHGLLFSPGKSLFLYAPPVLLALPGALLLWRRNRALTLLLGALAGAHIALYALWHAWDGGGVWGPRLLLPLVPLLLVLAAPLFEQKNVQTTGRPSSFVLRPSSIIVTVLLLFGLINALAGVLVNFAIYVNSDVPATQRIYNVAASPLLVQWQILRARAAARFSPQHCALGDGFFSTEAQNALLPRYTGARATITCRSAEPVLLDLGVNDYRPPDAPASQLALLLGSQRAALPTQRSSQVRVLLSPNGALTLANTTWNPANSGAGPRDAAVGTLLFRVTATQVDGTPLPLVDAAVEPPPASPRLRWGWYFVPYNKHLLDLWPWYLARSELAPGQQRTVILVLAGASLIMLVGSMFLMMPKRAAST